MNPYSAKPCGNNKAPATDTTSAPAEIARARGGTTYNWGTLAAKARRSPPLGLTDQLANQRQQLVSVERLSQRARRAEPLRDLQRSLARHRAAAGDRQDAQVRELPVRLRDDRDPIHLGHVDIENDEVHRRSPEHFQAPASVRGFEDLVSGTRQVSSQHGPDG